MKCVHTRTFKIGTFFADFKNKKNNLETSKILTLMYLYKKTKNMKKCLI